MLTRMTRYSSGFAAVAALTAALSGCAAEPAPAVISDPPTMAPEQSVGEACGVSRAEIDAMVEDARAELDEAGEALAAGQMPELGALSDTLRGTLDRVADGVSNPEVLAALDGVRAEAEAFGQIEAPDSLLGVPGYLGELGTQLQGLQAAGAELQELCGAG